MRKVLENFLHQLDGYHLVLFQRIWDALVINTFFKCKFLLVLLLLALDQVFNELIAIQFLSVIEVAIILVFDSLAHACEETATGQGVTNFEAGVRFLKLIMSLRHHHSLTLARLTL